MSSSCAAAAALASAPAASASWKLAVVLYDAATDRFTRSISRNVSSLPCLSSNSFQDFFTRAWVAHLRAVRVDGTRPVNLTKLPLERCKLDAHFACFTVWQHLDGLAVKVAGVRVPEHGGSPLN